MNCQNPWPTIATKARACSIVIPTVAAEGGAYPRIPAGINAELDVIKDLSNFRRLEQQADT